MKIMSTNLAQIKERAKIGRPFKGIKSSKPVHNLDSIIWTGLVIILQGFKLVMHRIFCTKL